MINFLMQKSKPKTNFLLMSRVKSRIQYSLNFVRSPEGLTFVLCVCFFIVTTVFTYKSRAFNSDDVSWQNILNHWRPFDETTVTLGSSNNYVNKIPFFSIFEWLFPSGRKLLLFESLFLSLAGFSLFYFSSLYFMKKAKIKLTFLNLLPFIWLSTFGYSFSQLFLNPIWRGFELGLCFAFFALVAKLFSGEINVPKTVNSKLIYILVTALVGITFYSDPYFFYYGITPILIYACMLYFAKKIPRTVVITVFVGTALSILFAKITDIVASFSGIKMATSYPLNFVDFDKLLDNIMISIKGILTIFGANFFGEKVFSLAAIVGLINFLILIAIALVVLFMVKRMTFMKIKDCDMGSLWIYFFVFLNIFVFITYSLSTLAEEGTYRYFAILVYSTIVILLYIINSTGKQIRKFFVFLLIIGSIANLIFTASSIQGYLKPGSLNNSSNRINFLLINELRARGVNKGYANYWQGIINTYLSNDSINSLPSLCNENGITYPFNWLIDAGSFNRYAEKSFIINDPDIQSPSTCTEKQQEMQFGKPYEIIKISNKTINLYSYDISKNMPPLK